MRGAKQNSIKAMKAFTAISIAEHLINSGEFKEAADRLLQAKVLMLSMLTSEELKFMMELADKIAEQEVREEWTEKNSPQATDIAHGE